MDLPDITDSSDGKPGQSIWKGRQIPLGQTSTFWSDTLSVVNERMIGREIELNRGISASLSQVSDG